MVMRAQQRSTMVQRLKGLGDIDADPSSPVKRDDLHLRVPKVDLGHLAHGEGGARRVNPAKERLVERPVLLPDSARLWPVVVVRVGPGEAAADCDHLRY